MANIVELQQEHPSRYGKPIITHVDLDLFNEEYKYPVNCMEQPCGDICCQFGTEVSRLDMGRMEAYASALEDFTGIKREKWFDKGNIQKWSVGDAEQYPGGDCTRTAVVDGLCIFVNRDERGCLIHTFCLENGIDVHEVKPMDCLTYPVYVYDKGIIRPSIEIKEKSLFCLGTGPQIYDGSRSEIEYYFGPKLTRELDCVRKQLRG